MIESALHTDGLIGASVPHVAVLIPNMELGGAERVTKNLVNGFVGRGLKVHLLLMKQSGALLSEIHPDVEIQNLNALQIRYAFLPLVRYLKRVRPPILLVHMWPLTVIAVLAKLTSRVGTKLVLIEHIAISEQCGNEGAFFQKLIKMSVRLLYPLADQVVTVSIGAAHNLAEYSGLPLAKIMPIYNPVVDSGSVGTKEPNLPGLHWWSIAGKRVLAVGTLKQQKDYPTLLGAFKLVVNQVEARLLVVGEGPERENLAALVHQLGLSESVLFCGAVQNAEPYYPHADLFVLSSRFEGLPTVLIEALKAGTPIVSTDCPSGPREILEGGRFGQLVPVGHQELLAKAILQSFAGEFASLPGLLTNRALDFSLEQGLQSYLNLLQNLLD